MSNIWKGIRPLSILALAFAITFAMACTKEVEVEVIKEVPVEVIKEVQVERVVTKEVPVEVIKEVIKEKIVTVEVEVAAEAVAKAEASEAKPIDQPQSTTPSGHIVIAVTDVPPGVGLGSAQLDDGFHYWGVGEATFQSIEGDTAAPMLATGYTLESDLSGGTMSIRDDVIFHGDWGPMTAADIAYTINDGNGAVNPRSIHWQAGDFAAMFGKNELTVIDDTTVGFVFNKLADGTAAFDPRWNANLLNDAGQAFSVQSTAVRDDKGEDWMRDNPVIATGPFSVVEWKQDDVGIIQRVPYDHWLINPEVETFTFREVAEEATKAALMETGEVDAALINLRALPAFVKGGFGTGTTGLGYIDSIVFSGNLWETHHVINGEPLDTAAVYMRDVQWVGNPIDDKDMAEAKNVRNGLARAIDRDLVNEAILGGLGSPAHINVFCNCAPEWQSKWEFPYDPTAANDFLDASGNTKNSNGVRFEMPLFANADHNGIRREVADAISGMWRDVGVDAVVQKFNYSVYRPTIVARATTLPWITSGDDGKTTWPWDWPKGQDHTSLTRGGYGIGVELPFMATTWLEVAAEPDKAKRIALNNKLADHLFDEAIDFGVVNVPSFVTYNTNSIASWDMDPSLFASWGQPEHIKLK